MPQTSLNGPPKEWQQDDAWVWGDFLFAWAFFAPDFFDARDLFTAFRFLAIGVSFRESVMRFYTGLRRSRIA